MNKMKVMVIAVLVLVVGSLHAQTRVDENKLTDISFVSQICDVKVSSQTKYSVTYTLDNGKGFYTATTDGLVICVVIKNGMLCGRVVRVNKDGKVVSYNMHDRCCETNFFMTEEGKKNMTSVLSKMLAEGYVMYGLSKFPHKI